MPWNRPPSVTKELAPYAERHSWSRRTFLARTGSALVGLSALGSLAAACGGGDDEEAAPAPAEGGAPAPASGTVNLLGWQGYDDPAAAKPLTDQGVKINATYITNNDEIVAKLRGGALGTIDIVTPYHGYLQGLVEADLLEPLDYSRIPSTQTYFPEFDKPDWNTFDGSTYSAPLVWGDTPIIYRTDLFTDLPDSWLDLKDPKYKGQLITLDDGLGNIMIYSRALFGPEDITRITKQQLDDVMAVWREVKKNLVTIAPSFGDTGDILARGDAAALLEGWRFVIGLVTEKGKEADAYMPGEGSFAWADSYCVPKKAPNPDGAYAFIDTMISAEGDALVGGNTGSGVTNQDAVANLTPDQQGLYPYDDIAGALATSGFYTLPPLEREGDFTTFEEWLAAWEELKSA
jgi:spermidine/putrescine transport system substrate-binding protein